MQRLFTLFILFLVSTTITIGQATITPASGGIDLVRSTAVNGSAPAFTTLGDIVILETLVADIKQSQTAATLILTAPANWQFNTAAGTVSTTLGDDITAISMAVTASAITITLTTANGNAGMNSLDQITITGIQVQPIDGNITAEVNILRTSASPGTAVIAGITEDTGISDGTNFGSLSLDPASPMPVELTSFSANLSGSNINLHWATATEVDNYGFEVQRLVKDDNWEVLGFVEGHGNSNSPKEYEFVDDLSSLAENSSTDSLEYRLKQIDLDGTFEYYGTTAKIEFRNITDIDDDFLPAKFELFQNYPNPFNPSSTIKFGLPVAGNTLLEIYNTLGQKVDTLIDREMEAGYHEVVWNASDLTSGIYLYKITTKNYADVKKMMMIK